MVSHFFNLNTLWLGLQYKCLFTAENVLFSFQIVSPANGWSAVEIGTHSAGEEVLDWAIDLAVTLMAAV